MERPPKEIPKLVPINGDGDKVQVETGEFEQLILKRLDKIDDDIAKMYKATRDGDKASKQYTDDQISALRNENTTALDAILKGMDDRIARNVASAVDVGVKSAMLPFARELSAVNERTSNNKKDVEMIQTDITGLQSEDKKLTEQAHKHHLEVKAMMVKLLFGVFGDGETSDGIIGKVGELEATTKKLDRVYEFIAGINWRFVAVSVGGISSAPVITAILKVFNII